MPRRTKTQQLQAIADELKRDDQYDFAIEWRGNAFWAVPDESRWIGDDGECLGNTVEAAERTLRLILG